MGIFNYLNPKYSGSPSTPISTGDRYWDQDLLRDHRYYQEQLGLLYYRVFGHAQAILYGLNCSQGTGHTLNVSAGYGISYFSVEILHRVTAWAVPPNTENDDIIILIRIPSNLTNQAISSAVTDGVTTNYIKLAYTESDGNTRARAKKTGSYAYEVEPDYILTVDDTAPTSYEVVLETFTSDGVTLTFLGNEDYRINKELNEYNNINIQGITTEAKYLKIGNGRTANGFSHIDLIGDTTYTSYGARILRGNTGANADTIFLTKGTGDFILRTENPAPLLFQTNGANTRVLIDSSGKCGIGTVVPNSKVHIDNGVLNITKVNAGMPETGSNYIWNTSGIFFDLAYNSSMYGLFGIGTNGGFSGDIMYNYFRNESGNKILASDLGGYSGIRFNSDGDIEFRLSLDGSPSLHKTVGDPVTRLSIDAATGNIIIPDSGTAKLCIGNGLDAQFSVTSDNLYIDNITLDKNIYLRVNNGATIDAFRIITASNECRLYDSQFGSSYLNINSLGSGNRIAHINLYGDSTSGSYGLRIIRNSTGENATSQILHNGTGTFYIQTEDAADINFQTNGSNTRFSIDSSGQSAFGPSAPASHFDIQWGGICRIGANYNSTTRSDSTIKNGYLSCQHYTNSEEPSAIFYCSNTSSANNLYIGGNSSLMNAATTITFYTAADTTTLTGSAQFRIQSDGGIFAYNLLQQSAAGLVVEYDTSSKELYAETCCLESKTNIREITGKESKIIYKMKPVIFDSLFGKKEKDRIDYIADYLVDIAPNLVVYSNDFDNEGNLILGTKKVAGYNKMAMIPLIGMELNEHEEKINKILKRLEKLEGKLNK